MTITKTKPTVKDLTIRQVVNQLQKLYNRYSDIRLMPLPSAKRGHKDWNTKTYKYTELAGWPNQGLGLLPYSIGYGVIDVDKGDPRELIEKFPPSAIMRTTRGWHLWYALCGDIQVDKLKKKEGRYLVGCKVDAICRFNFVKVHSPQYADTLVQLNSKVGIPFERVWELAARASQWRDSEDSEDCTISRVLDDDIDLNLNTNINTDIPTNHPLLIVQSSEDSDSIIKHDWYVDATIEIPIGFRNKAAYDLPVRESYELAKSMEITEWNYFAERLQAYSESVWRRMEQREDDYYSWPTAWTRLEKHLNWMFDVYGYWNYYNTGGKHWERNEAIRQQKKAGVPVKELMERYKLKERNIYKIIKGG